MTKANLQEDLFMPPTNICCYVREDHTLDNVELCLLLKIYSKYQD